MRCTESDNEIIDLLRKVQLSSLLAAEWKGASSIAETSSLN